MTVFNFENLKPLSAMSDFNLSGSPSTIIEGIIFYQQDQIDLFDVIKTKNIIQGSVC